MLGLEAEDDPPGSGGAHDDSTVCTLKASWKAGTVSMVRHLALVPMGLTLLSLLGCSETVSFGVAEKTDVVVCLDRSAGPEASKDFLDRFWAGRVSTTPVSNALASDDALALNWGKGADTKGRQEMLSALRREAVVEAVHENSSIEQKCGTS
jgi:hypothetical protein